MVEIATISRPVHESPSRAMKAAEKFQRELLTSRGGHPDAVRSAFSWARDFGDAHRFLAFDTAQTAPRNDEDHAILPGSADSAIELTGTILGFADMSPDHASIDAADPVALPALWEAALPYLGEAITIIASPGTDLSPAGSDVGIASNPTTDFLVSQGLRLTEAVREFHLTLTQDFSEIRTGIEKHPDYRLVQWNREVPPKYVESFETLAASASHPDLPAHLHVHDQRMIVTAAQHIDSGEIVAYSQLSAIPGTELVIENATVVADDHRGKGLALRMRLANISHVRSLAPEATHAISYDDQVLMAPIHARLGFTEQAVIATFAR